MIQFETALAAPAGALAAPSGAADIGIGGTPFDDILRALDRRRDGDEELRQRESGPAEPSATQAADPPESAERPPDSAPSSDAPPADESAAAADSTSPSDTDDAKDEAAIEADASPSADALLAAATNATTLAGNAGEDAAAASLSAATGDEAIVGGQASSASSPNRARRHPGAGIQATPVEPDGSPSAGDTAAAGDNAHVSTTTLEELELSREGGGRQIGGPRGRGPRSPNAGQPVGELANGKPATAEPAGGVPLAELGLAAEEGIPADQQPPTVPASRPARGRGDQRRLPAANDGSVQSAEASAETAGAPAAGGMAGTARAAAFAIGAGESAESDAIPEVTGVPKIARPIEPAADAQRIPAPLSADRATDPLGEGEADASKAAGASSSARGSAEAPAPGTDRLRFVQRVMHALQAAEARGTAVRLRLSPPELGSLRLELTVRGGVMLARLEVESADARALLLDSLPQLRERLAAQEIKIERFEVDLMNQHTSDGSPGAREREHAGNAGRRGLTAAGESGLAQGDAAATAVAVHLLDASGINVLV